MRRERVQLTIKKSVTARELFANMLPLTDFDDNMIPKLIERVDVVDKTKIKITFRGGLEVPSLPLDNKYKTFEIADKLTIFY